MEEENFVSKKKLKISFELVTSVFLTLLLYLIPTPGPHIPESHRFQHFINIHTLILTAVG